MPAYQTATLIAEVGTATTRLTLVDLVDGDFRLIARAEGPSTPAAPEADATVGILAQLRVLETITGRELIHEDRLWMPGDQQGNGVAQFVVTTSAAMPLTVAVAALAAQQSARTAFYAARGAYTTIQHIFAIDEAATDSVWLSRQVMTLAELKPEAILIAGGHEGSPPAALERLGQVIGLVNQRLPERPAIIYAGNSAASDAIRAAIGDDADVTVVDNLRPHAAAFRLGPARSALEQCYLDRRIKTLPGHARLEAWGANHVGAVAGDQGVMLRFLAERFRRDALALDVGAAHSAVQLQSGDHYSQAILTYTGTGAGAANLLGPEGASAGAAAIQRWLPFDIEDGELRNRLLNRVLGPALPPITVDDLLFDHALIREAITATLQIVQATRPDLHYDFAIAGGALARAPHPGFAALVLLDTLVTSAQESYFAIDLYLDRFGLLAASGALARLDADAAISVLERDGLSNGPLATVVVPYGELQAGKAVLQAELTTSRGERRQVSVAGGQIVCLALARGQRGTLRIQPAAGVRIGANAAGAEVVSDEAAISGSALGIIIDARPRPLVLPSDAATRRELLWSWLAALQAVPPVTSAAETPAAMPLPAETRPVAPAEALAPPEEIEPLPTVPGFSWESSSAESPDSTPMAEDEAARPEPEPSMPSDTEATNVPWIAPEPWSTPEPAPSGQATSEETHPQPPSEPAQEDTDMNDPLRALRAELVEPPRDTPEATPKKRGFFRRRS